MAPFRFAKINDANSQRRDSFDWAADHAPGYIKAAIDAATSTIARHNAA